MSNEQPKFKNQKDSYKTEEERFALLQEIESYVQSKTKDPTQQILERRKLVLENPDIFYPLYKDYELSPKRKAELESLADTVTERLSLSSPLMDRLVGFQNRVMKDKIALCQDIVKYLVCDAGIDAFPVDLAHPINVVVKPLEEGLNGYRIGNEICINQNSLKLDGIPSELFDTLSHETLHVFQKKGHTNFTELSALYYVNTSAVKDNAAWKGKAYQAYQNQPKEKEAWFFGSLAGEQMTDGVATAQKMPRVARNILETLTGEKLSIQNSRELKLERGMYKIPFSKSLAFSGDDISPFFGSGIFIDKNPGFFSQGGTIDFKIGQNETAEQFITRLSTGTQKMRTAVSERDQFKQTIQNLFPTAKPVSTQKGIMILEGSNPEIQQWIHSMGTNASTRVLKNGNLSITLPLVLQKDGQPTTYEQAFPIQYTHLCHPKGFNFRVLMGGDGKAITSKSFRQRLSILDYLREAANGGQGESPMDKHNAIDYRDVGGKERKPDFSPKPTSTDSKEAEIQRRSEEIRRQFGLGVKLAEKKGKSL